MPSEHLHDVRCRVRSDSGKFEQRRLDVVVAQTARGQQRLKIEGTACDVARDRANVRAAIPHPRHVAKPRLGRVREHVRIGKRAAPALDQRGRHANRRRPTAIRRANRLYDIFENGWTRQQPARARRGPSEQRIAFDAAIERREIVGETDMRAISAAMRSRSRSETAASLSATSRPCLSRIATVTTRLPARNAARTAAAIPACGLGGKCAHPCDEIVRSNEIGSPPAPRNASVQTTLRNPMGA